MAEWDVRAHGEDQPEVSYGAWRMPSRVRKGKRRPARQSANDSPAQQLSLTFREATRQENALISEICRDLEVWRKGDFVGATAIATKPLPGRRRPGCFWRCRDPLRAGRAARCVGRGNRSACP
ncbi:hypothetical protein GCM10009810_15200 [Nostocoides vanveenii]|uniref:Uncharacterized protein n=1 Tax=Nostocoides vanveenii TaxID=330835 RepID=A0ABN2KII3_9MICO